MTGDGAQGEQLPDLTNVTMHVCSIRFASEWTEACKCGEALSTSAHRKAVAMKAATNARAAVLRFIACEFLTTCRNLQLFSRKPRRGFEGFHGFVSPQMKRVCEDDVTEDAAEIVVAEINCGIELKVRRDVAGKTDGR